ncbi:MAG: hemerythrin domain-containing protein [Bacilli bacterium]
MLNRDISINEIITKYPKVQEFLIINDVDCMKCSVKSCLLKDILEYHNFSKEDQVLMYEHMDKLALGETEEMPKFSAMPVHSKYSKIVETLIDEHKYIKELIYMLKYITTKKDFLKIYQEDINKISTYLSLFADKFHHQKEEDLLFCLFRGKEIVEAMYEEHELGRSLRANIINSNTDDMAKEYIDEFCQMLENHIYKEDNVLFPYLDKHLSSAGKEKTALALDKYDKKLKDEVIAYIEKFNNQEFSI